MGSGASSDLFVMGHIEAVSVGRGGRGSVASSAYKMHVLMSWDIDVQDPARSKTAAGAERQAVSSDGRGEGCGRQIEVSNGLLLHEVC